MQDSSLVDWMEKEFAARGVEPSAICVQTPEQEAARFIKKIKGTVDRMRSLGVAFAIEHYGVDKTKIEPHATTIDYVVAAAGG